MVTYFNKKDLVNFGKYLLSDKRTQSIIDLAPEFKTANEHVHNIETRLKQVSHADVENFLESIKKVD